MIEPHPMTRRALLCPTLRLGQASSAALMGACVVRMVPAALVGMAARSAAVGAGAAAGAADAAGAAAGLGAAGVGAAAEVGGLAAVGTDG